MPVSSPDGQECPSYGFSANWHLYRGGYQTSAVSRQFQQQFPSVHKMLVDLKTNNHLPKPLRHKQLAHLLQNLEASLLIGRICAQAMEQNVPVITLHDGLFTTPDRYDELREIAELEFARLGPRPTWKPVREGVCDVSCTAAV